MAKKRKRYQKRRWEQSRGFLATGVLVGTVIVGMGIVVWTERTPPQERVGVTASGDRLQTVSAGFLPAFAASESSLAQNAYRYAVAQPEVLRYIPCYCGCKGVGHRHNGDCYIQARHSDGTITFTSHGAT